MILSDFALFEWTLSSDRYHRPFLGSARQETWIEEEDVIKRGSKKVTRREIAV